MSRDVDVHYHANHVDAPARGSKRAALRDARRLHVSAYNAVERIDPRNEQNADTVREHGIEFPLIVRCYRSDCRIEPA